MRRTHLNRRKIIAHKVKLKHFALDSQLNGQKPPLGLLSIGAETTSSTVANATQLESHETG